MKRKLLCLLLALALLGAPAALAGDEAPKAAEAAETHAAEAPAGPEETLDEPVTDGAEPYSVWVSGRQITSANRYDVMGDGSVSFDPSTVTLTLKNAESDNWDGGRYESALIYSQGVDLTVVGSGTLIVYASDHVIVVDDGSLTLDGDLDLTAFENTVYVPDGDITLRGGSISIKSHSADHTGVLCYGSVRMTGGTVYAGGGHNGIYTTNFFMSGGKLNAVGGEREGIHAGTDIILSGGSVTAEGGGWGLFAYGWIEIGNGVTSVSAAGESCAILADKGLELGNMLTVQGPKGARVGSDGKSITLADGVTAVKETVLSQIQEEPLSMTVNGDGTRALVQGDYAGLFARVALILDNGGVSGLYVTQVTINADGTILVPTFFVPGLTVKGVNVALVSTLADIQSPTPNVVTSATRMK